MYYDPDVIKPETMLALIKKKDCPRAAHTKAKEERLLNPFIAPGDPVQISINAKSATKISNQSKLPSGWKIVGKGDLKKGDNFVTLTVPSSTQQGRHDIRIAYGDNEKIDCQVNVVRQVGKH